VTDIVEVSDREYVIIGDDIVTTVDGESAVTIVSDAIQGPPGAVGERGESGISAPLSFLYQTAGAISGHRIVLLNDGGKVDYASSGSATHAQRIVGMTTHAAIQGDSINVQKFGDVTEPSWNWQTDKPVYLGIDGVLTQSVPLAPESKFSVVVGFPISATTLFINIGIPITLTI